MFSMQKHIPSIEIAHSLVAIPLSTMSEIAVGICTAFILPDGDEVVGSFVGYSLGGSFNVAACVARWV